MEGTKPDPKPSDRALFTESTSPVGAGRYLYLDMRGHWWDVLWNVDSKRWDARPVEANYGYKAMAFAAFSGEAGNLIREIEAIGEEYRVSQKTSIPWWLILLGLYAVMKGRKR